MISAETLLSGVSSPAVLIGPDERIAVINAAAERLLGHGQVARHYITALRQPAILDAIEQSMRDSSARKCDFLARDADKDTTWRASLAPVAEDKNSTFILITFDDISPQQDADLMRRDFVSNVSHELRTPLTAVLGFVETLRGAARHDADARERFLGIISREADRMAKLVDDLLSLSRVEEEERKRPTTDVSLTPLINGAVAALEPLAVASNVSCVINTPAQDVIIKGDHDQLHQVLTNLIENAVKYGGADKDVTITLTAPEHDPRVRTEAVHLTVKDEGEGIPSHQIPRLTERFYRLDGHRSRELGGTGLGLAIVKHIISRHRGRLRIESTMGQGSTFTVILPVA